MKRILVSAVMCAAGLLAFVNAQVITFNQPSAWMSSRSGDISVKALIDTARLEKKSVDVSIYRVSGKQKKKIGTFTTKSGEYSQEFSLAKLQDKVIGGREFLKIEWSVKGMKDKGNIQPFGLAVLGTQSDEAVATGKFIGGSVSLASALNLIEEKDYQTVGSSQYAIVWNEKALAIICKKVGQDQEMTFCFDGKNGKNAFLSYPDRFISYNTVSDSIRSWYYTRNVSDSGIVYSEKPWVADIVKESDSAVCAIIIPWHETGLIPFNGRMLGFSVFSGKTGVSPKVAKRDIPATWGNMVLSGGPAEKKE